MKQDQHWADPIEGPDPQYAIDLDKGGMRLVAAALLVFWFCVGCVYVMVKS